ncbi:MAG: hypothetical protein ACQESP_00725 [Candidatus Muiribacteriota bacterium]
MKSRESKILLLSMIIVFGLIGSGYTVRNAEFMIIAEEYTKDFESYKRAVENTLNEEELKEIQNKLDDNKEDFMHKIKKNYSSDLTDKLMLNFSYKKFNNRYNNIKGDIESRLKRLGGDKTENELVSINFKKEMKPDNNNEDIVEEAKQIDNELETKEEVEGELPVSLIKAVVKNSPGQVEVDDIHTVVKNESENDYLVLKYFNKDEKNLLNFNNSYSDFLNKIGFDDFNSVEEEKLKIKKMEEEIINSNSYKSFKINDRNFEWRDNAFLINDENFESFRAENIIVQIEGKISGYGSAYFFNGKEFTKGVWLQEDEEINYYDNLGNEIKFYGSNFWINICPEEDFKI